MKEEPAGALYQTAPVHPLSGLPLALLIGLLRGRAPTGARLMLPIGTKARPRSPAK